MWFFPFVSACAPGTGSSNSKPTPASTAIGVWDGPLAWPVAGVHGALLPSGELVHYSFLAGSTPGAEVEVFDPATNTGERIDVDRRIVCGGTAVLPDGRLLAIGGTGDASRLSGIPDAHIFDPQLRTWTRRQDSVRGRFGATLVTLPNGNVSVLGGIDEHGDVNQLFEEFDAQSGWIEWPYSSFPLPPFPRVLLVSSDVLVVVGPGAIARRYDRVNHVWSSLGAMRFGERDGGTAVLLPGYVDRVLAIGGSHAGEVTDTTEWLEIGFDLRPFEFGPALNVARVDANAVILAEGSVLVVGGSADVLGTVPVLACELLSRGADSWRVVAPAHQGHAHHSSAVLLPDGRVIVAGGNAYESVEVYSPWYCFEPRPEILSTPDTLVYGAQPFAVQYRLPPGAAPIAGVALVRSGSSTHGFNADQRYVPLGYELDGEDGLLVNAPSDAATAPPGYYQLVVTTSTGVPSIAATIRL